MTDLNSSPIHLLHRARQHADELLTRQLAFNGITPRQFAILYAVNCNPGLSQAGITELTGSDRSTITELVTRLQRNGLIKRERSRADARAHVVRLTDKGQTCIEESIPAANSADEQLISKLPVEQRQAFVDALVAISSTSN